MLSNKIYQHLKNVEASVFTCKHCNKDFVLDGLQIFKIKAYCVANGKDYKKPNKCKVCRDSLKGVTPNDR